MIDRYARRIIKSLLRNKHVERRLRSYYGGDSLGPDVFLPALIHGNAWLFSKMKSGTTLLANTIAFYNAERVGAAEYGFDDLARYGVLRGGFVSNRETVIEVLQFLRTSQIALLTQTHRWVKCSPRRTVLTTRNALDYCVSSYFFNYKHRKGREHVDPAVALPEIVDTFVAVHKQQERVLKENDSVHVVSYEHLMSDTRTAIRGVLSFLFDHVDDAAFGRALEASSRSRLVDHELRKGHAAIAAKGSFLQRHFVRSGEVGEGQSFFSDEQREFIFNRLSKHRVDPSGRFSLDS